MEPLENAKSEIDSRATEIDTGAYPLLMENVLLGLPQKPTIPIEKLSVTSKEWTYTDLVSQKKLLTTIQVNASTPSDKPIYTFRNTWSNVCNTHFRTLNNLFLLKSWTLNFLIEFRSTFQHVGMFNITYTNIPNPLIEYLVGENAFHSYALQVQLPHRKVFMGEDWDVHVGLKWVSPFKSSILEDFYYPGTTPTADGSTALDDYDMGSMQIYAPFKMETAQGVNPDMTVRVWSYLTDVDYSGYVVDDTKI